MQQTYPEILLPEMIVRFIKKNKRSQTAHFSKIKLAKKLSKKNLRQISYIFNSIIGFYLFLCHDQTIWLIVVAIIVNICFCCYFQLMSEWYKNVNQKISKINKRNYQTYTQKAINEAKIFNSIKKQTKKVYSQTYRLKDLLEGKVAKLAEASQAQRGVSEKFFFNYLEQYFGNIVIWGQEFTIPSKKYCYSTDYSLIEPITGLSIDIEIDEPYDGKTGKPHHCIDTNKDRVRNQFFLSNNWVVIRFAEEQIVRNPLGAIWVIASVIEAITGIDKYKQAIFPYYPLIKIPKWNWAEASAMARENARQKYLAETGVYISKKISK